MKKDKIDITQKDAKKDDKFYYIIYLLIIITALITRIPFLGQKPLHHDESLHAYYSWSLSTTGNYEYLPMTHGPFLYYVNALIYYFLGPNDFNSRITTVIFGILILTLIYLIKNELGKKGMVFTCFFLAFAPSIFYLSRFLRHDIYMLFWTLFMVSSFFNYLSEDDPFYLHVLLMSAGFAYVTTEASYIILFIFASFLLSSFLWERYFKKQEGLTTKFFKSLKQHRVYLLHGFLLFVFIYIMFFSSFFSHLGDAPFEVIKKRLASGLPNPFDKNSALGYWLSQHEVQRGGQPIYYYTLILTLYEFMPLIIGIWGIFYYFKNRSYFTSFLIYWFFGAFIIFSWAGEKFPWLVNYPLFPLLIITGKFMGDILEKGKKNLKIILLSIFFILLPLYLQATFRLSYVNPYNPEEMAVYTQTSIDVPLTVNQIETFTGYYGRKPIISLHNELTWPFVWYFRDYTVKQMPLTPAEISECDVVLWEKSAWESSGNKDTFSNSVINDKKQIINQFFKRDGNYMFRQWWVPPVYKNTKYSSIMLADYFFKRKIFGETGSMDFTILFRSNK